VAIRTKSKVARLRVLILIHIFLPLTFFFAIFLERGLKKVPSYIYSYLTMRQKEAGCISIVGRKNPNNWFDLIQTLFIGLFLEYVL